MTSVKNVVGCPCPNVYLFFSIRTLHCSLQGIAGFFDLNYNMKVVNAFYVYNDHVLLNEDTENGIMGWMGQLVLTGPCTYLVRPSGT